MTLDLPGPLVAREPDDLIALVPLVLGFEPAESVTLMTFVGATRFHARVDLPDDPRDDPEVWDVLLGPVREHAVEVVGLVVHSRRATRFVEVAGGLVDRLLEADVRIADVLRADGRHYWCLHCTRPDGALGGGPFVPLGSGTGDPVVALRPCPGHPYDVTAHPFTVQAVWAGQVVHRSREELAATLEPDRATRRRHGRVQDGARAHGCLLTTPDVGREAAWVRRTLRRHLAEGTRPDDGRLGRLLVDLSVGALRDAARELAERSTAREHVELWRDAVRRAPDELLPPVAGVLAYVAWLAGDGALAWCAVDRGRATGVRHDLLDLVADLLTRAVPPATLESLVGASGAVSGEAADGREVG